MQASVGDLLAISGSAFASANKTAASYTSGPIGAIHEGTREFYIVEPITGTALSALYDYDISVYSIITSDGASVSAAAMDLDVSIGDSVVVTGKGTSATDIRTFAFTNGSASGKVSDLAAATPAKMFNIAPWTGALDDVAAEATDALTVDGAVEVEADFEDDLSNGDGVTYSKKGGKQTIALTNASSCCGHRQGA